MRKKLSYVLVVLLVVALAVSMGSTALAADSINTTVKVSPSSLPGAGTVSVTVTIKNNGDPINNVVLKYPAPTSSEITIGNMASGDTREHANSNWSISEDMLGKPMAFTMYWTSADGTQKSGNTDTFTIAKQAQNIDVTGTASADEKEVSKGDEVQFTFTITNQGNVKLDNAYLTAPPIDDGQRIGSDFQLDPGGTETKRYRITVTESMDVKPVVTYAVGGQQYTKELETVQITVKAPEAGSMSVQASVDHTQMDAGQTATFTLGIKNSGTSALSNITAKDFNGNAVTVSPTSLQAGETATATAEAVIPQSGNYAFTVTAQDESGNAVTTQSNSVAITTAAAEPTEEPTASASSEVDLAHAIQLHVKLPTTLNEPGQITAEFEVVNRTDQDISNVQVSEATLGVMASLSLLPAGASQSMEKTFMVEESGDYVFRVTGELPDGTLVSAQTPNVPITVKESAGGSNSAMVGLVVILIAIAAVSIVLVVYIYKNKKKPAGKTAAQNQGVQRQQRQQQTSPSGRPRPQRYGAGPEAEREYNRDTPPIHEYQERPRAQRVETIEPKPRQSRSGSGSGVKFGDRNKF